MPNADAATSNLSALASLLSERCMLLGDHHFRALLARMANPLKQAAAMAMPEARITVESSASSYDPPSFDRVGPGVASIPIIGVLTKYPTSADWVCGLCPTMPLISQLADAVADDTITAIVLDIDCPGGFVNGTVEFADAVAAADKVKPVISIIRGMCCSGGYWIASQARKIISRREAEVGNIGVYSVLMDVSKFYESLGIDLTLIASGQFKGLGADGKVTDDLKADTHRIITGIYQQFTAAVIAGRNGKLDPDTVTALFDGKAYLGPEAKKLHLVDALATSFDAAIQIAIQESGADAPDQPEATHMPTAPTAAVPGAKPAVAKPAAAKSGDNAAPDKKGVHETLNSTITSANKHKDQARSAMDTAGSYADDMEDDTVSLANQCISALKSSADESNRAAKAWQAKLDAGKGDPEQEGEEGGDTDGDDNDAGDAGEDDTAANTGAKPAAGKGKPATSAQLLAAFGDDAAFCLNQLVAKATMEQASVAYAKSAAAKIKKLEKQLAEHSHDQSPVGVDGTRQDDPVAAAGDDPEAVAKAEWKANRGDCRAKFLNEGTYVAVRKRELASA